MSYETVFYQAVVTDCEAAPLDMAGMAIMVRFEPAKQAVDILIKNKLKCGSCDYSIAYTAGHYGEEDYIWDFSHHEIYEPVDKSLPSMVILRYKPRNESMTAIFYGEVVDALV